MFHLWSGLHYVDAFQYNGKRDEHSPFREPLRLPLARLAASLRVSPQGLACIDMSSERQSEGVEKLPSAATSACTVAHPRERTRQREAKTAECLILSFNQFHGCAYASEDAGVGLCFLKMF